MKIHKFQPFFHKDELGSGDVFSDFIHSDNNIPENAVELLEKKIQGTLHDIYTLPRFEDFTDINNFFINLLQSDNDKRGKEAFQHKIHDPKFKEKLIEDLILAYKLAVNYLKNEGYYLPRLLKEPKKQSELMDIVLKGQKYSQPREKIAYCTLLKEILGIFRIIRYGKFNINYKTCEINLRNEEFMKEIRDIFEGDPFKYYSEGSKHFSSEFDSMRGYAIIDGIKTELYVGFRVKSFEAMLEKMDAQEKYNVPEAHKDTHGMRIEVATQEDALRIARILFYKLGGDLELENIGNMINKETYQDYSDKYLEDKRTRNFRDNMDRVMKRNSETKKKNYSEDRQELKLARTGNKPVEIQIVLVNNTNETGYAHHDIYKIRRKIVAKIRRHGWVSSTGIQSIIKRVFDQNKIENSGKCTIPYGEENIYNQITQSRGFLVGIRGGSQMRQDGDRRVRHYSTHEVIEKYKKNYPNSTQRDNIFINIQADGMQTLAPISQISFSSTPETSSLPPSQGQ